MKATLDLLLLAQETLRDGFLARSRCGPLEAN